MSMQSVFGLVTLLAIIPSGSPGREMVLAPEQRIRSPGTAELSFDLAEVPKNRQVRLSLDARVDSPSISGSNPFMIVHVNARDLRGPDLINKPVEFTMRCGMDTTWVYGSTWRICYSPDFSDVLRTVPMPLGIADCDPYRFVWDVTPYVKPGKNAIRFTHPHLLAGGTTLVLRAVRIEVGEPGLYDDGHEGDREGDVGDGDGKEAAVRSA